MRLAPPRIEGFLAAPPASIGGILVFGPDRGLVRERAARLVAALAGDPPDPFALAELDGATIKTDPVRLADEAMALGLSGRRRVVRIRDAADALAPAFAAVLDRAPAAALLVAEAGDLPKRSALRRLFEEADSAAAIGCYEDDRDALQALIDRHLIAAGVRLDRNAGDYLLDRLGADRGVSCRELEKLVLYTGGPGTLELDEVVALIGDSGAVSLDTVVYAAVDGDLAQLDRALAAAAAEGLAPVSILRAVARHVLRLWQARLLLAAGRTARQAMLSLKPPVIFRCESAFRRQLERWPPARLAQALDLVSEAELACKTTGTPAALVCARTLMQIAQAAGAGE
jgi:DNA polymerase-3 subunit delta